MSADKLSFIIVSNNGADLIDTNYWETDYALHGYYYLSINAGALRLLVPDIHVNDLKELTIKYKVNNVFVAGNQVLNVTFNFHNN